MLYLFQIDRRVDIFVEDVNDNAPTFVNLPYRVYVPEVNSYNLIVTPCLLSRHLCTLI